MWLWAGLVVVIALGDPAGSARIDLIKARDAIKEAETRNLAEIGRSADPATAARIKAMIDPPRPPLGASRFVPLAEIIPPSPPIEPPALRAALKDAATKSFDLATRALKADPPQLAIAGECLRAAVGRDPGNAEAWRLLGYIPHKGGWATPFASKKEAEGYVLHPVYGWVEKDWVPHLEKGELPAPFVAGRPAQWLPAAQADALRRDFARGWQISTEHFNVRTNVPLAEVIAFGRHLEAMHELFFSIMADLIGPEHPILARFRNPKLAPTLAKKSHLVFYFNDREEFIQFLVPVQGQGVRDSLGTYLTARESKRLGLKSGTSFFFRDLGGQLDVVDTLNHEVSHQLLFESAGADKYDEARSNFWVFEGLGTYFETVRPQADGSIEVGGLVGSRIAQARVRLIDNGEFVPLGRLVSFNRFLFNGGNGNDIYLNYAEAMAMAVYMMQAHEGRHRAAFLDYARDVYKGRIRPGDGKGLEDRLGGKLGEIDRDFLSYLKAVPVAKPKPGP